jgi:Flp pilus assembly protein TadG
MRRLFSCDRGQAVTELALVLPILLLMLLGIVELGRLFHAYLVVQEAARDAVRYVSVAQSDAQVEQVILQNTASLQSAQVTYEITPQPSGRRSGEPVSVTVQYPVQLITPVLSSLLPNPYVVSSTMTMRKE